METEYEKNKRLLLDETETLAILMEKKVEIEELIIHQKENIEKRKQILLKCQTKN